jgi:transposase-like protein
MGRHATPIVLEPAEQTELERRERARTSTQQEARRARIVLRAAAGEPTVAIAAALGCSRRTVQHWRDRFAAERLAGLADRPHCPPARAYGPAVQAEIVVLACRPPAELGWAGQTHWSIPTLARAIGAHPELGLGAPSTSTVGRILQAAGIRLERL